MEWKFRSTIRKDRAIISVEVTDHSNKHRTVSEISLPAAALPDLVKEAAGLAAQQEATEGTPNKP